MKYFKNLEEMQPYYNKETNTYEFEDDIRIGFGLKINSNIKANDIVVLDTDSNVYTIDAYDISANNIFGGYINTFNIDANDICAYDMNVYHIKANHIKAENIDACDINATEIAARNVYACDINADNINVYDIKAHNINANNVYVNDVTAYSIDADNIIFYAVCTTYSSLKCKSIKGIRGNSFYKCLDGEVEFKE